VIEEERREEILWRLIGEADPYTEAVKKPSKFPSCKTGSLP
jgi:hypothetical protein